MPACACALQVRLARAPGMCAVHGPPCRLVDSLHASSWFVHHAGTYLASPSFYKQGWSLINGDVAADNSAAEWTFPPGVFIAAHSFLLVHHSGALLLRIWTMGWGGGEGAGGPTSMHFDASACCLVGMKFNSVEHVHAVSTPS